MAEPGHEGFDYDWGYIYLIEVEDHPVSNPPADGSSIRTITREIVSRERVEPGTEFEMFLTGGPHQLREVEPGLYRVYDSAYLACGGGVECDALSEMVAAGSRIGFRLRHPASADQPLEVVSWRACDPQLIGSVRCSS